MPKGHAVERRLLPAVAQPIGERGYAETDFPSLEHRLLAAFRVWGVINYFFPYRDLIAEDWEGVLREFLPRFHMAADATAYAMTIAEMVTRTRDSHCFVRSAKLDEFLGVAPPAVRVRMIEGTPVVTDVYDQAVARLDVGDVVIAVDGVDVKARLTMLSRYHSASTPQALEMMVTARLLCGPDGSATTLTVRGSDEELKEVKLPRAMANWELMVAQRSGEILKVLPGNIGYADLDRLPVAWVDDMFERFKDTKAIIFDIRGYPHGTAWAIAPRLTDRSGVAGALFERPIVSADVISSAELEHARFVSGAEAALQGVGMKRGGLNATCSSCGAERIGRAQLLMMALITHSHSALRSGGTSGMARPSPRREGSIRNLGDSASALVA